MTTSKYPRNLNIKITQQMAEDISKTAFNYGITKASFIRKAIFEYIKWTKKWSV